MNNLIAIGILILLIVSSIKILFEGFPKGLLTYHEEHNYYTQDEENDDSERWKKED